MSELGLVVLILAALVVAAVVILFRVVQRRPGVEAGSPRTVADLVRMRAEQAAEAPAAVHPVVAHPVVAEPVAAEPEVTVVVVPAQVAVAREVPLVAADPRPVHGETPAIAQLSGSDTPWGRAARMTGGGGAVWASGDPDHDWSGWADWTDVDDSGSEVPAQPEPRLRPVVLPVVSPDLFGPRTPAPAESAPAAAEAPPESAAPARPVLALVAPVPSDTTSESDATIEESAVRRRTATETAAEQAAADLALLRTFGCAPAVASDADDDDAAMMSPAVAPVAPPPTDGAAQTVAFRVIGRDGDGIEGAGVTLLDDRGRETTGAVADAKGRGEVRAPHPGSYVVVSAAPGHQPGAVAIMVAAEPVEAEVLLARSASVAGTVFGEDGPIVGARLTLVQDGEVVDTTGTGPDGAYWISDLAAGDYGLSVSAHDCEPAALLLTVPDETDLHHDVELVPVGLPAVATTVDDDVMIGHG